jgi:hypothetical protein
MAMMPRNWSQDCYLAPYISKWIGPKSVPMLAGEANPDYQGRAIFAIKQWRQGCVEI